MAGLYYAKLAIVTMAVTMAFLAMANGFVAKNIGNNVLRKVFNVDKEFDYLTLALNWPASYCKNTTKCCKYNACCKGSEAPNEFVIHGLWPDYEDGTWPSCCSSYPFNAAEISSLADDLTKYWPTFKCKLSKTCNGTKVDFLTFSWETHGTCSYPVLQNEYSYFSTALDLFYRHNVTALLSEAGYVASSSASHSLEGIVSTIKNAYGANPYLTCDSSTGAIKDVRLCFTKDLQIRDCGNGIVTKTCSEKVILPSYTSSGINHGEHAISWMDGVEDH